MPARDTTVVCRIAVSALVALACSDSTAPPKPTRLFLVTHPPSTAETMVPLTIQPSVQIADANGAVAGEPTTITASVIAGPGEIESGGTATTNATGLATFSGLTLGGITGAVGSVTLQFAAPGLDPVTTDLDLYCALDTLSVPQSVSRSLTTGDCANRGEGYINMFALTTSQSVTAVQLTLAAAFPGNLVVGGSDDPGGNLWGWSVGEGATNSNISYKALLPAGRSLVAVASEQLDLFGAYTLTTAPASEDLTCDFTTPIVASPITSAQQLGPGDCGQSSFLEDFLIFGLPANATITASMTSSAFDPWIEVDDGFTESHVTHSTGQGSASLTYTNTGTDEPYYLVFTSAVAGKSGPYNFTLNIAYPSGSAARAALELPSANERLVLPKSARSAPSGAPILFKGPLIPFHARKTSTWVRSPR